MARSTRSPGQRFLDLYLSGIREEDRPRLTRDPLLAGRLVQCLDVARAAWPSLDLPAAVFLPYLARRIGWLPDPADPGQAHVADLYLACACQIGADIALDVFERAVLDEVRHSLERMRLSPEETDEVLQRLRVELFVTAPPLIGRYAGRGTLRRWAVTIARHDALKLLASRRREAPEPIEPAADELVDDRQPFKRGAEYAEYVAEALRAAIQALPPEDRRLLRLQSLDGLSRDELAHRYNVHRATIARWLASIRAELQNGTRHSLKASLGMQTNEVDSVIRQVRSQLDVSLERILATAG